MIMSYSFQSCGSTTVGDWKCLNLKEYKPLFDSLLLECRKLIFVDCEFIVWLHSMSGWLYVINVLIGL